MTKKYQPDDRCQVAAGFGIWLNATVISTREGHGGALVRIDGWAEDVWAKSSELRDNPVNPTSQKRGDYTPNQLVEVQYTQGRWVEGNFSHWEDDTHERAFVATDQSGFGSDRFHYTNIRPALRMVPEPDPHSTAYQGEVGDHQPRTTETVAKYGHVTKDDEVREVSITITPEIPHITFSADELRGYGIDPCTPPLFPLNPDYGHDVNGTFTKPKADPWERLREMADELTAPKPATTAAVAVAATLQMGEALTKLGAVTNTTREKIGYIEAAADFAMMGITPEQLRDFISAFAHTIVTGATPEDVERFARQTLRDKWTQPDEGLHHITREYRGAR